MPDLPPGAPAAPAQPPGAPAAGGPGPVSQIIQAMGAGFQKLGGIAPPETHEALSAAQGAFMAFVQQLTQGPEASPPGNVPVETGGANARPAL